MHISQSSFSHSIRPFLYLAAASLLYPYELLCAAAVFMLLLHSLSIGGWKRGEVLLALIVGIAGPLAEAVAIHFGSWQYGSVSIFTFPLWLPAVWAGAALFILRLGKQLGA